METLLSDLVREVLGYIIAIALAAASGYAVVALHKFVKFLGLQNSALLDSQIEYVVKNAIDFAEEKIAARLKSGQFTEPIDLGAAKLEAALAFVLDALPGVTRDEADALVHSYLGRLGKGATEFARELKTIATN